MYDSIYINSKNRKKKQEKLMYKPGMLAQACNLSTQEAEVGRSCLQGQPWQQSEFKASPDCVTKPCLKLDTPHIHQKK
jgi:hypothetical protein